MKNYVEPPHIAEPSAHAAQLWHTYTVAEATAALEVNLESGLSGAEAEARLARLGLNRLQASRHEPWWEELLEELREPLIMLLFVVGVLYTIWGGITDGITIFCVIAAVVGIEVFNESRAHRAIAALGELAAPRVLVRRDSHDTEVATELVVPGDVLILEAGERLAADARLIQTSSMAVDQSALTGESVPADKVADIALPEVTPLAERSNLVFAGTVITRGRGTAVAVATGPRTEIGHIAALTRSIKPPRTALQRTMRELSRWMVWLAVGVSVLVPLLGWLLSGMSLKQMVLTGLSLAFATIPEELPILITIVLALGAFRLSRRNAIVKRLQAAEILSAVDVIATDKTGTITENRMQVRHIDAAVPDHAVLMLGALANDASERDGIFVGDPIDVAFLDAARSDDINVAALRERFPVVHEYPFDTDRKAMSVVYERDGQRWCAMKGAPESVLGSASRRATDTGNHPLTEAERETLLARSAQMAAQGLRVLALAEKPAGEGPLTQATVESSLTFLGLVGLADPPRPEVPAAITACRAAGIRTIMVTGDHPLTARAIAELVGLGGDTQVLTGPDLNALSDQARADATQRVSIYARATPEHKLRIVEALQHRGHRVAVTGDGINDAPALAAADIGVAMGERGTDVAREAADMVLADDNFATIVAAVAEGRLLFANLRKAIRFYLAAKVALIMAMLLPILLGVPVPFTPIQIVMTELFMDVAATATFVAERPEADLMRRPPRDPAEPFMNRRMVTSIFLAALGLFAAVSIAYLVTWYHDGNVARAHTVAFDTWLIGHVLLALHLRSEREPVMQLGMFSNKLLIVWAVAAAGFAIAVTLIPGLHPIFKTTSLPGWGWALVVVTALACTSWLEVEKWLQVGGGHSPKR